MSSDFGIDKVLDILSSHELLLSSSNCPDELSISGLATDSRLVKPGDAFICIKGFIYDGHDFARKAQEQGASLLICEEMPASSLPVIRVKNSREAAAWLCRYFYKIDDSNLKLVGITGTNGKTTTAWLMYQLATKLGVKAGFIGTTGGFWQDKQRQTVLTTPDIIDLFDILHEMQHDAVKVVFMEVSSHAMAMQRLSSLRFSLAAFLNLSQDHLDFHSSLAEYASCKYELFRLLKEDGLSLINMDDKYGRQLWPQVSTTKISLGRDYDIYYNISKIDSDYIYFTLSVKNNSFDLKTKLKGDYNLQNLSFAVSGVSLLFPDIDINRIFSFTEELHPAPGRLEKVENSSNKNIYIDYAHTPEAIAKVTKTVMGFTSGRLITIIGAGGNRDKAKRPYMLDAALEYSDLVIVTTDNPRFENPVSIISDMMNKQEPGAKIWLKTDRRQAIMDAVSIAAPQDTVLITGKGHETYQEINGKKMPFDERKIIAAGLDREKPHRIAFDRIMLEYICLGKIISQQSQLIYNISTDTRNLAEKSLFIPIKGQNFDGHDFINEALTIYSNIALTQEDLSIDNNRVIKVSNTLETYGKIASCYRRLLSTKVIGITGSTGKTSVKEQINDLLSQKYSVSKTYSNENNYIGTAKTLLEIKPSNQYSIIELGTNHPGEIAWLTKISKPEIAIITNIGPSHLEYFGSLEGVFKEKVNIFSQNPQIKIFPGDDIFFQELRGSSFGFKSHNTYQIRAVTRTGENQLISINNDNYTIPLKANYHVNNSVIAIIVAQLAGLDNKEIESGLKTPSIVPLRQEELLSGSNFIIADCYNANPASLDRAIDYWKKLYPKRPHGVILGSMLELGSSSEKYHRLAGEQIRQIKPDFFFAVGKEAKWYGADKNYKDVQQLRDTVNWEELAPESIILLKGSHGIHLERLLKKYDKKGIF